MADGMIRLLFSIAITLALVGINGVFVAVEFAIVRVRRNRLEELAGEGRHTAKEAVLVVDRVIEYLAVTQIGVTAASLGVCWFGEDSFARLFILLFLAGRIPIGLLHVVSAILAFLLITTLHVVAGKLVPKHLAIRRAFEFADKDAEEILIEPERVDFISLSRSFKENLAGLRRHMHARLPLCHEGLDSVVGVIGMKDAWPLLLREKSNAAFERAARPPIKIPVGLPQDGILRLLQDGHGQMGIVRDAADKRTLGIITLEDVLKSLVGDVREVPGGGSG